MMSFKKNIDRWYFPVFTGFLYAVAMPPFNSQLHPAFSFFPLLSFFVCIPLFLLSINASKKRAILHTYIFGICASIGQLYWIAFVTPEGLWPLIIFSVLLLVLYEGIFFTVNGILFRWTYKKFPGMYTIIVPAWWVLIEYSKSLGEVSFPWTSIGYSLTPLLPVSQISSITGIYGMSFIIVLGNALVWKFLNVNGNSKERKRSAALLSVFAAFLIAFSLWGWLRLHEHRMPAGPESKIALVQPDIDQNKWGSRSLDTSFDVIDSMLQKAALDTPGVIILPESALLCYLVKQPQLRKRVEGWSSKLKTPMVLGSLDWQKAPASSLEEYSVYNAAFFLDSGSGRFQPYYKVKLVPFSEALPFQGIFPILSRVNLGQADFKRGAMPVTFNICGKISGAPFICFDIIYPGFVRDRAGDGVNLLIHITNDGWFGKSSGPYQHAVISRQRCIENGISMVRCANSGISMFVDQYGRIVSHTRLSERTILTNAVSLTRIHTFYSKLGDWPVALSGCIILILLILSGGKKIAGKIFNQKKC